MKKFSVLIAVALLAVAGTGYAVTCAQDYVPAASLLVPHFRVSRNNSQLSDIQACATCTNTLMAIVNVSTPGVIAHVTVWNKYSRPVLDFNVPLTGKDVAILDMRKILNGDLNNINVNSLLIPLQPIAVQKPDPCGLNIGNNIYEPNTGFGPSQFIRFSHPDSSLGKNGNDAYTSISVYSPTAFTGNFRAKVWDSLDESGDISEFFVSTGLNILDTDNPACAKGTLPNGDSNLSGDFSGYLTIDVVNYCTNFFPNQPDFYSKDAIATRGWCQQGIRLPACYSPNVLFGDVFYIDPSSTATSSSGNVSGDPMVSLEWDVRLEWTGQANPGPKTFYGRNVRKNFTNTSCEATNGLCNTFVPAAYTFGGDGREPLGDHYGFRYYSDVNQGPLQSWAIVWREDLYRSTVSPFTVQTEQDLCTWLLGGGKGGAGLYDDDHQVIAITYDNDENFNVPGGSGGPSGDTTTTNQLYIFLESQRLTLLANKEINPGYDAANGKYLGGWIDLTLRNSSVTAPPLSNIYFNQAWVGVQHSGAGQAIGVGHLAALLYNDFVCIPWGAAGQFSVYKGVSGSVIYP